MSKFKTKRALVLGVIASLVVVASAIAYWTTSGSGTGTATTGTNTPVTVTQLGSVTDLVPGGAAQAVDFKINNPVSTKQYVTSVTYSIASIKKSDGTDATGCSAADF